MTCTESLVHNWRILKINSHPDKAHIDPIPLIEQKEDDKKADLERLVAILKPMFLLGRKLETYKLSNGHNLAPYLVKLYASFTKAKMDPNLPQMFKDLLSCLEKVIKNYIDGRPHKSREEPRIRQRIDDIRLIQAAFYVPNGRLNWIDPDQFQMADLEIIYPFDTTNAMAEKRQEIQNRMEEYDKRLTKFIDDNKGPPMAKRVAADGRRLHHRQSSMTDLEREYETFIKIADQFAQTKIDEDDQIVKNREGWPEILYQLEQNILDKKDANVLFWNSSYAKQVMPRLRNLVMQYIAIPSSSSFVEAIFSHANDIKTHRRSSLKVKTINVILTCTYSFHMMPEYYTNEVKSPEI